jgi:hypothetical protein
MPKLKQHLTWEKEAKASHKKKALQVKKRESPKDGDAGNRGEPSSEK